MEFEFEFENQTFIIKESKEVHGAIEVPEIKIVKKPNKVRSNNDSKALS